MASTGGPVAILGAGNGGHCMAADLSLAGHEVVSLGSSVCDRDFRAAGRGLDALGLADLPADQIVVVGHVRGARATSGSVLVSASAADGARPGSEL